MRLLLTASRVDSIEGKVVIVAGAARETDGTLIAAAVVLREGREQREAGPVASIIRQIGDLVCVNHCRSLGRTAVRGASRRLHLDLLANRSHRKLHIQSASLADANNDVLDDV